MQIVVASDALEYAAAALKKIHDVVKSNTSAGLDDCLSRIYGSDSCDGLRFVGDIVKVTLQMTRQLFRFASSSLHFIFTSSEGEWSGIVSAPVTRQATSHNASSIIPS